MAILLEMTLTGGVLILLVLLLRAIFLNRLPKTAFIVMWAVVLLRLLLPVSFFSTTTATDAVVDTSEVYTRAVTATEGSEVKEVITLNGYNPTIEPIAETAEHTDVFKTIWLVGAIVCAIALAISYIVSIRRFNRAENIEADFISSFQSSNKLRRTVTVRLSDKTSTPLTYGIIHPVILLPAGIDLSDRKQLRYVLMHEYIHIRKLDNILKGISNAAVCIHWFNPLVWVMNKFLSRDIELRCDEALLKQCEGDCRADYATTLIDLEDKRRGFAVGTAFSMRASEERIVAIMKFKPTSAFKIVIATALIAIMVTVAFAAPFNGTGATTFTTPINADDYTVLEMNEDGVCYVQLTKSEKYENQYYIENIAFSGTVIFTDENGEPFFFEFDKNDVGGIDFYLDDVSKTVGGEEYGTIIDSVWSEPLVREYDGNIDPSMTYSAFGMEVEYDEDTYCFYYFTTDEMVYLERVEVTSTERFCSGGESYMKYVLDGVEYDIDNESGVVETYVPESVDSNFSLGNSAIIEFSEGLTANLKAGDIVHITVAFNQDEDDDVRWAVYEYKKDGDDYTYSPDGVLKTPYATEIHRMSDVDVTFEITEDGDYCFALANGSENGEYLNIVSATVSIESIVE